MCTADGEAKVNDDQIKSDEQDHDKPKDQGEELVETNLVTLEGDPSQFYKC